MQISLVQNDVEQLLRIKTENKNLDYKQGINWDKGPRASFAVAVFKIAY